MEPKELGKRKSFTEEELTRELDRLMHEQANNQQIKDWVEVWCDCTGDKNNVWGQQLFITYFQLFFLFFFILSFYRLTWTTCKLPPTSSFEL